MCVRELANLVESKKLLEVSQLEQEIVCTNDHNGQLQQIRERLKGAFFTFLSSRCYIYFPL